VAVRERPVGPVGEDLVHDGVVAVLTSAWISSNGESVNDLVGLDAAELGARQLVS
jgi:hypothetical protein